MKELTVVSPDRIGLLADVSEALGKKNINIESISVETTNDTAIIRLSTSDEKSAKKALEAAGFSTLAAEKMLVRLKDKPGELARISRVLADEHINIENVDIVVQKSSEKIIALSTDDNTRARKILGLPVIA